MNGEREKTSDPGGVRSQDSLEQITVILPTDLQGHYMQ